jgi:DNA-binding NtrC family response regulator
LEKRCTILIADRNPHVRELLKREMIAWGYHILLAKSAQEVLHYVYDHKRPLDLLILELDLPDTSGLYILEKLQDRIPTLPVIVHTYLSEYLNHPSVMSAATVVEKNGNSIEELKKAVSHTLGEFSHHDSNNQRRIEEHQS